MATQRYEAYLKFKEMYPDFSDPVLSEPIFWYCSQTKVFDDMCRHSVSEDLSLTEYVAKYDPMGFAEWFLRTYNT